MMLGIPMSFMELSEMEKILERGWKEDTFKVIDKHIKKHEEILEWAESLEDLASHGGAIAALIMLKRELNGEVEY